MAKTRGKADLQAPPPDTEAAVEEDVTPVASDGSGWTPHPSERRDFYHRIRVSPADVSSWRRRMLDRVRSGTPPLPLTASPDPETVSDRLDDGISYLREIARILAVLYGTPDLGNKPDPTDELVYIILSRKTPEKAYQETFTALKARFPRWDDLLDAPRPEVEKLISPGGLAGKKATSLYGALQIIRDRFGWCSLEPARGWSDEQLEQFLCGLPEVQRKSAYCIMMYSFGRQVFPADTHVGRVLARLGPYRELGLDLSGLDHKKLQMVLADLMPPPLRYSLHVNLIEHGRAVCHAPKPLCESCDLRPFCGYYRAREAERVMASDSPTVVDMFCGAGGSSEGFVRAGFKVLAAVDLNETAIKTYRLNHPGVPDNRVICGDNPTLSLSVNCRNTRQVASYVQGLSGAGCVSVQGADGPDVQVQYYSTEQEHFKLLRATVNSLIGDSHKGLHGPEKVVILTPDRTALPPQVRDPGAFVRPVSETLIPAPPGAVRLGTVHGFKGLEATCVVLTGFQRIDTAEARRLLYVGGSRARGLLKILLPQSCGPQFQACLTDILASLTASRRVTEAFSL